MMLRDDGLYYDYRKLKYHSLEEEGDLHVGGILSLVTKAIVPRTLDYDDLKNP